MIRAALFILGLVLIVVSLSLVSVVLAGCVAGVFCCLVAWLDQRAAARRPVSRGDGS